MKKKLYRHIPYLAGIALFAAVVVWFVAGINSAEDVSREKQLEAVRQSVENGVTLCYAIEGAYPESLEYLSENYGLTYDSERYLIHYDCFAANVRPGITVVEKGL